MLTSLGEAQAATLAQFWLRNHVQFDEVYCGLLARQMRTEQVIAECFRTSGEAWPPAQADAAWNEYDVPGVLRQPAPADPRLFQRMFEAAMLGWLEGDKTTNGVEPWTAFRSRVSGAIGRLMEGPPGRRVALYLRRAHRIRRAPRAPGARQKLSRPELAHSQWFGDGVCLRPGALHARLVQWHRASG